MLNIVWGAIGALVGLVVLVVFGIVGTTIRREPDAAIALPIIGVVGGAISLFLLLLSVPSIVGGIGLLKFKPWSRILTIVVSGFHLLNIPFGTALGIYGLWVLCSQDSLPFLAPSQGSYPKA